MKALVCTAALAAGLASTLADGNVYSLNVVGYYNIPVAAGQRVIIANQLNTTNNTIGELLKPPMVDNNDQLFKFAGGFAGYQYSADDESWIPNPDATLNPGEAAFFLPAAARTLTFVGEVLQGNLVNTLPLNTRVLRASMVPQQGLISTDLGVPYDNNDQLFVFNVAQNNGGYAGFQYSADDESWIPSEPTINVGQGFFYIKDANAAPSNATWTRNFTVQ